MPIDDIATEVVGELVESSVRWLFDSLVFGTKQRSVRGVVGRYSHGIGRRIIWAVTLGRVSIPSSVRQVKRGARPKPDRRDWLALWTGVVVWTAAIVGAAAALISGI